MLARQRFCESFRKSLGKSVTIEEVDVDESHERGYWGGRFEFILSAVGYAVGLGNVWRFPYMAYKNGGGSFLIPYLCILMLAGLPLFLMEMSFGQFSSLGPISVWNAAPLFKGLGYAMIVISSMVCVYYNMVIAYTLYYFFVSLKSTLPWQSCKPEWKELYKCQDRDMFNSTTRKAIYAWCKEQRRLSEDSNLNLTTTDDYIGNCTTVTPSQVYWERVVLDISDNIDDGATDFKLHLVLCLLLAWVIVFLCLMKGIKSSGKVVYITATFPYIVLVILFFRNITLDGAYEGIEFYIVPKWDKLYDPEVWYSAAIQIFYSLGVSFGGLETMASYNRFKNNIHRDVLIVALLNCGTSVFAGFVIFSVVGFMSHQTGLPVDKVVDAGPGLAFIAYPEGIAMMKWGPLWAVLFFLMLFTLGLDSQFATMETVISALVDEFPMLRKGNRKIFFTFGLCVALFLIGIPQCARNGVFVMTIFDSYSAGFSLIFVSLLEVIAITYVYGVKRFIVDIEMMLGFKLNKYWQIMWTYFTPLLLSVILIFYGIKYSPPKHQGVVFPTSGIVFGWMMVVVALLCIPITMGKLIYSAPEKNMREKVLNLLKPNAKWGPQLEKNRTGIYSKGIENEAYTTKDSEFNSKL